MFEVLGWIFTAVFVIAVETERDLHRAFGRR